MFPSEMGGIGGIFSTLSASTYGSVENGNPQNELIPVDTWVMFNFKHERMGGWLISRVIKWSASTCNKG